MLAAFPSPRIAARVHHASDDDRRNRRRPAFVWSDRRSPLVNQWPRVVAGRGTIRGTVTDGGASAYVVTIVHESQIAGCGRAGRTVTFRIAGHAAGQSSPWQPGAQRLDINSGGGSPVPLPTATPTSRAAPSIPTKASGETVSGQSVSSGSTGNPTPLAGTPPVDNINIPFVPTPSVQRSPVESVGVNEGERSIWIVLGPLIALAVAAGIGGGIYLSRRKAAGS